MPVKQWVNIDPASPEAVRTVPGDGVLPPERCGQTITLTATIEPAEEGRPIYWGVQLDADNLESTLADSSGWTLNAARGGFSAPGFYEKLVPTDASGQSITTFRLSHCGGDKFTIKAFTKLPSGDVDTELQSEVYEVWRILYYQVTHMGPSTGRVNLPAIPDITWATVKNEYNETRRPHHLKWAEVPAGTAQITRHRSLYNESMQQATGVEGYDRAKEPYVLKICLVDMLAERAQEDHTFDVVRRQTTYTHDCGKALFDLNSADDRTDWFISATAQRRGGEGEAITITRDNFSKQGDSTIAVRLDTVPRCRSATVSVQFYVFDGTTAGFSWYNGIWVSHARVTYSGGSARIEDRPLDQKHYIMVHELGHAIGMVPSGAPHYYPTSHGHTGGHCSNGAAVQPGDFPASENYTAARSAGACCTMFGSISSSTVEYCDECSPFVRSRRPSIDGNFRNSHMMPASWAPTP